MKKLLSKSILKQSVKNNWKLWLILTGVLCFFITVMTLVAPNMAERMAESPGPVREFSLISIYEQMIFGMMGITLMLIYAIAVGNKLVASEVDKGTMSFTLNTPITRKQLIFSKAFFYLASLVAMAVTVGIFGTVTSLLVSIELPLGKFWLMILGYLLYGIAISGICFFASCWFNKSSQSLMVGAGLPVAFFLFDSLAAIPDLKFLKYFSLNTLFDTTAIVAGSGFTVQFVALFIIGIVLYALGISKFLKKDLPL